jgi:hypothetical protein
MGRTWIRQDVQVGSTTNTDTGYVGNTAPSQANYETNSATLTDDLNNLRSSVANLLKLRTGNWYDDINTPVTFENGAQRPVNTLNQDLHDLERKRVLVSITELASITVPAAAYATGTLTGTVNFVNGDTVTIASTVYTFMTPWVDGTPFTVDCTTSLADTLQNLRDAINLTGTIGTQYGTGTTIHPTVSCTANTGTTLTARAKVQGTGPNLYATLSSVADPAWGAAKLANGAGDINVLTLSPDQLPTWALGKIAAIGNVTTRGTVAAYAGAGLFETHQLATVSGSNAINPKNLCVLEDVATHDPILSSGRVVHALFQTESNTDGSTMTGTTPNRAQLSYVRINTGGTALEAVPTADIAGKVLHYASVGRKALEDLDEQDFLRGAVIDVTGPATVDRQITYDNQGTTPVELITNATLDINSAGLYWRIRDLANAALFTVTEGSTGGASTVALGPDTDVFDSSAILNDFDKGAKFATGGAEIDVGTTVIANTATIESIGATTDLRLLGSRDLYLDDVHQAGSTWAQTNGIKLSASTQEWDDYETAFGSEVSLLKGITDAFTKQKRTKVQAVLTADVTATNNVNGPISAGNCDVNLPPYDLVPVSFVQNVEVYLNGELLRNNASAGAEDVYPGTTAADGDLKFTFKLKGTGTKPDQLTVIVNGQ